MTTNIPGRRLGKSVKLTADKILTPQNVERFDGVSSDAPVLVILAAGKGTRFGASPKCAQPVCGVPLARHSIDNFRSFSPGPVICLVGYRHDEVMPALGDDNIYVHSSNPRGGTAFAAYEAFSVEQLTTADPLLIITMGDRIVTPHVFERLVETHFLSSREAQLTLLSADYEPPKNRGKGRVLRDEQRRVVRIIEQRDIDAIDDAARRSMLLELTEGNCPLYAIRASTLRRRLEQLDNNNAQRQYYFTDIVEKITNDGGEVRTITTSVSDPEYDLLCADVTRPMDLAMLQGILQSSRTLLSAPAAELEDAARGLVADRPIGQTASIAEQLQELLDTAQSEEMHFDAGQPIAIGVSGGRLRIAFMHPDMGRFYGPAWQMPSGARDSDGREQVVVLVQSSDDGKIHLLPTNPAFRERLNYVAADEQSMYPSDEIADWYSYESFGTRMTENLLLSLGYFSDDELEQRRQRGRPLPPPSLWIDNSMRRPFSLIGNAIASMRTLKQGNLGAKVQTYLGRDGFRGLRLASTGNIPQGGFSSSSAVTVAVKNAINALYQLGIAPDLLVHLACQAEYGTGVRAGSLDQATEQKGKPGEGALISSNPRDNYRILGEFPVPADRFHVLFPYSVDRDRTAWRWSAGAYAESPAPGKLTSAEMRKMTGKSAELAALLTRLPLHRDFFQEIEQDLMCDGVISRDKQAWVNEFLSKLPLHITQEALRQQLAKHREWLVEQFIDSDHLETSAACRKADATFEALLAGWRDPVLCCGDGHGRSVEHRGAPLRAMLAYLFGEVAKNFYLIHHPDQWIEYVSRSQQGDRCLDIDPRRLPSREEMSGELTWEQAYTGPGLMDQWLERFGAAPFDFNGGLDDASLADAEGPLLHEFEGGNFFRGLALIDLAEAMLRRAFGEVAVAVRVNAAGQGDYFQVHVDTHIASTDDVKEFIRRAFYRRFGLAPIQDFVEPHPGGAAVGVRLSRFDRLPDLIERLRNRVDV